VPEVAHLTLAELPGSLAIWIAGLGFGFLVGSRAGRAGLSAALASLREAFRS
jgi:hypothetical protein